MTSISWDLRLGMIAAPSRRELWVRSFRPEALPEAAGFRVAVEMGPHGTVFEEPARVTLRLPTRNGRNTCLGTGPDPGSDWHM